MIPDHRCVNPLQPDVVCVQSRRLSHSSQAMHSKPTTVASTRAVIGGTSCRPG